MSLRVSGRSLFTTQISIGREGHQSMVRPLPPHPTNYTSCSMHPPRWRVTSVSPNIIHELADSFSLVHQLPRLETINLTFCPVGDDSLDPDGGGRLALQASILDALAASFSVRAPPNLTSLSLRNLRILDDLPLESPSFQTFLTPLRRLELSVFIDRGLEPETFPASWCHFWTTTFPRMVPAPTHNSLTELTLHGGTPVGASAGLSLAALHFPRLCALSLRDLVFEPSVAVEPFVLRHAATLARLELLGCALPTGTDTHLSLSGSEESSPRPARWERIWDRFAAELTALVALHVDSWGCLYLWPCPGVSFYLTDHQSRRLLLDQKPEVGVWRRLTCHPGRASLCRALPSRAGVAVPRLAIQGGRRCAVPCHPRRASLCRALPSKAGVAVPCLAIQGGRRCAAPCHPRRASLCRALQSCAERLSACVAISHNLVAYRTLLYDLCSTVQHCTMSRS
ncbi:hypothetical protein EDB85DRAFT_1179148 [Lactarius pseudohatsudake]|nr:hypothetical protein EDB85DRAFT_1179148 [Lactarius pseudohatsudake]